MARDRIVASGESTVINRSELENSFNRIGQDVDPNVRSALLALAQKIKESQNEPANAVLNAFVNELEAPKRNPSKLRSHWDGLVRLVPDILQLTDVVEKVKTLFS